MEDYPPFPLQTHLALALENPRASLATTASQPTIRPQEKLEPSCPVQFLLSKARQVATQIESVVVGMI